MQVRFEYNFDDLIDAQKRFLERSNAVKTWRWQDLLWTGVIVWGATCLLFFHSPVKGLLIGLGLAVLCMVLQYIFYRSQLEKRLRRMAEETYGDRSVFVCEVELTKDKLVTKGENTSTTTDWKDVTQILVTTDTIDIFAKYGGGVIVRDRAFKSVEEKQQFADLARNYFDAAH